MKKNKIPQKVKNKINKSILNDMLWKQVLITIEFKNILKVIESWIIYKKKNWNIFFINHKEWQRITIFTEKDWLMKELKSIKLSKEKIRIIKNLTKKPEEKIEVEVDFTMKKIKKESIKTKIFNFLEKILLSVLVILWFIFFLIWTIVKWIFSNITTILLFAILIILI